MGVQIIFNIFQIPCYKAKTSSRRGVRLYETHIARSKTPAKHPSAVVWCLNTLPYALPHRMIQMCEPLPVCSQLLPCGTHGSNTLLRYPLK